MPGKRLSLSTLESDKDASTEKADKKRQSIKTSVNKKIRESIYLKNLSFKALDGVLINGMTLRGTLVKELEDGHDADGRPLVFGKNYYQAKAKQFVEAAKSVASLPSSEPSHEEIRPEMMEAMMAWKSHPINMQPMLSWIERDREPTRAEAIGALNCMKELKPGTANKHHTVAGIRFVEFIQDQDLASRFSDVVEKSKDAIDKILLEARKASKRVKGDADLFASNYKVALGILHHPDHVERIQTCDTDWYDVRESINVLCTSKIGELLYGGVQGSIVEGLVKKKCEETFRTWNAQSPVMTMEMFKAAKEAVKTALQSEPGVQTLGGKRKVLFLFLGHKLKIYVGSVEFEVDLRFAIKVKEMLIMNGIISPMWVERDIAVIGFVCPRFRVHEDVYAKWVQARKIAVDALATKTERTAEVIRDSIGKSSQACEFEDPTFIIHTAFFSQLSETIGYERLQQDFFDRLGSLQKQKSIKDAAKDVSTLPQTLLWKCCGEEAQSSIRVGIDLIHNLSLGVPVEFTGENVTPFLLELKKHLPVLVEECNGKKGLEGLKALLEAQEKTQTYAGIETLQLFAALLDAGEQERANAITAKWDKTEEGSVAKKAKTSNASTGVSSAAASSSDAKAAKNETVMASMQMFKLG